MTDTKLPPETTQLTSYDLDLLRKLRAILLEQTRQIEQRPCCVFEDAMYWLMR